MASDGADFDLSEVQILAVNIGRANGAAVTAARGVVKKGLDNIKSDTRENISDHKSWKRLASTVNYEIVGLEGVVGYDDVRQGELAGIYEFGSALRAPHPTLFPAAARELPKFEQAMGSVVGKSVEDVL
jgi:hypothetical protein